MKYLGTHVLGIVLMAAVGVSTAAPRSPHDRETGELDYVSIEDGKVVVDDRTFLLPTGTAVTLASGQTGSMHDLKKGAKVGFTVRRAENQRPVITHIWVLPKQ
jgi:hypothetical protein